MTRWNDGESKECGELPYTKMTFCSNNVWTLKWSTFEYFYQKIYAGVRFLQQNDKKKKRCSFRKCAHLPWCFVVSTQRQPLIQISKWFLNDTGSAKRHCVKTTGWNRQTDKQKREHPIQTRWVLCRGGRGRGGRVTWVTIGMTRQMDPISLFW